MYMIFLRERIIKNNPVVLPNESERSVERPQQLLTPMCTPVTLIDLLPSLFLPPSSSIYWLVLYLQSPHPCSPPPLLLQSVGFFLCWSLQWKLLWWTTPGAYFVLAPVRFWKWYHSLQWLPSSYCPQKTRNPFPASSTHIYGRVSDWSIFLWVYHYLLDLPKQMSL